jgi:hypothetical protein
MPELALDDVDRHSFTRELDRVRVPQLMGREPPPHASVDRQRAQFGSRGGRRPPATTCGSVDHAEQRSRRQRHPQRQPSPELFEPELVHPSLAAFVTLAVADQQRPPAASVAYIEGEAIGIWTHGHVKTLNPASGPDDLTWPEVLTQLTRRYGGSLYEWGAIVYYRLEPTWMVAYASGE